MEDLEIKLRKGSLHANAQDFLTEYNDEMMLVLRECIDQHRNLMRICYLLEQLYNPIVLVKSLQITLQVCNLAFVSTKVRRHKNILQ